MKKLRFLCIVLSLIVFLSACGNSTKSNKKMIQSEPQNVKREFSLKGVWISYFELESENKTFDGFKAKIDEMFESAASAGFNAVFVHTRANGDAIYKSDYYPFSRSFINTDGSDPDFSPLEYMAQKAHSLNLSLHAWINPYRIASSVGSIDELPDSSPAAKWLRDGDQSNDGCVKTLPTTDRKISVWLNPARQEVRNLVINGVREIVDNYDVDGIHIDDYFYPTTDESFDKEDYTVYAQSSASPLSLDDWRRLQVDLLVSALYRTVHSKENLIFGISPAADISNNGTDKNYRNQYADIAKWVGVTGYCDYIAPQLYFGFDYPAEDYRFENLLDKWSNLKKDSSVKFYVGLAAYKQGETDAGSEEWLKNTDILMRQAKLAKKCTDGIIVYSYSSFFSNNEINTANRDNLSAFLKSKN